MTSDSDGRDAGRSLTPEAVFEVWRRRRWMGLLAAAAVFAGALTAALALPNLYRATATVLVERQEVSEAFVRPSVTAELETRIQTIHQQVMSRARLTDVITQLDLYPTLRDVVPMDALVERMRNEVKLDLRGAPQSSGRTTTIAFALSFSGRDPETVARVANTLAGLYVEENSASRERQAAVTATFLQQQLAAARQELDEQDRRINDFKVLHSGELLQQVEVNLAALDRLNTQLRLNADNQSRALERRRRLEEEVAEADSGTAPEDSPAALLARLNRELADLRRTFSEEYPDVIRLRAAVAAAERQLSATAEPAGGRANSTLRLARQGLADLDGQFDVLKKEEQFLRRTIAQYESRAENAPKRQQDLQQLSRDYESTNERYKTLLKRYEEAQLAEHLEEGRSVERFRPLDPAIAPTRPAAPNREWLLVMGLIAALGAGLAVIIVAEKLDTTFHDSAELQSFAPFPILATVRQIRTTAGVARRRRRVALIAGAAVLALSVIAAGSYYVAAGNESLALLTMRSRS